MVGEASWALWIGTLIGLFIGLVIKDAASALGKRLLHRVTPGFTEREAEAQKAGELAAIQKDLHNLVAQTTQITSVQSQIQAEINGDLWKRQTFWQQKREMYANMLKTSHSLRQAQLELFQATRDWEIGGPGIQKSAKDNRENAGRQDQELSAVLEREFAVAEIFLNDKAIVLVREFRTWKRSVGSTSAVNFDKRAEFIDNWIGHLIEAAREDLGAKHEQYRRIL